MLRPELRAIDYKKRINAKEVKAVFLELFPSMKVSFGGYYNSNNFLLYQNWLTYAAQVSWNLLSVFRTPAKLKAIDANGQYVAPAAVPAPPTVTVRAASTASPTSTGSASVTILPLPDISSVTPSPVAAGSFTLTVNGAGFSAGSLVSFDGALLATTFVSTAQLTATGSAPAAKPSVPVVVHAPDGEKSDTFYVAVTAPQAVTITISPTSATVRVNRTRQFTATVQNASNKAVIWKVKGVTGGNSAVGTISTSGLYRAPASVPNPAVVTVSATAAADQTKAASASVTVSRR